MVMLGFKTTADPPTWVSLLDDFDKNGRFAAILFFIKLKTLTAAEARGRNKISRY